MRTGAAKRTMFRKFFAVVVSAILILTAAASICASADDKSAPEFTKEEFLDILRNAEIAAVLYTRPEASTRTELAKFISSNFSILKFIFSQSLAHIIKFLFEVIFDVVLGSIILNIIH